MDIVAIAARDENNLIGNGDKLPWHLPEDLKFFKAQTLNKPVILGRKTWESFGKRPLPNRPHFIVTRQSDYRVENATICSSLQDALNQASQTAEKTNQTEIMIIGGAEIYKLAYPYLTKMILTRVHGQFLGDIYFPTFPETDWSKTILETHSTHTYEVYTRITQPQSF